MADKARPAARNAQDTKARILAAAQQAFSEKPYSQAGLREIARRAGVAGSLIIKYFSTKAELFEEALTGAMIDPRFYQQDRARFGAAIVASVDDPGQTARQPAMIALSMGDEEARPIVARVARKSILEPMARWLGPPNADARASHILMLTMGYVIFARHLATGRSRKAARDTADLVARQLQAVVDMGGSG